MVRKTIKKTTQQHRWQVAISELSSSFPQLYEVLSDEESFISLLVRPTDDGSTLGILKRYGSDGGPMVCFGVGYGVVACFLGLDSTVAAGAWRVDKPWKNNGKQ